MPMKSDKPGRRSMELVFDVPGTPEQVWRAIATGKGIEAWFVPSQVEERVGGSVTFELGGGMVSTGEVTEWKPPERFAYEEPNWSGDAPPLGTEFIIEALSGDTCRIRLIHSLASDSERWDDEVGGMETGWPGFFEVLRIYLADFADQPAASVRPMAPFNGSIAEAWADLTDRLGLAGARIGDHRALQGGAPALSGMVSRVEAPTERQAEMQLRLDSPSPGVALFGVFGWDGKSHVSANLYFYGESCEALAAEQNRLWEAWFAKAYPPSAD